MTVTKENSGFHVLVAAAGSGERLGGPVPKQYVKVRGKSILRHTIENILRWPGLKSARVIIDPVHTDLYQDAVSGLNLAPPVTGGKTRKQSINNALSNISDILDKDIVLVHDAARPLVDWSDVSRLLASLKTNKAATLARPVTDTLRRNSETIDRKGLWTLQTPQGFYFGDLKTAHQRSANDDNFTDDTGVIEASGINVQIVEGSAANIKVTTPDDLLIVEALLARNTEIRTGMGLDVHAFDKANPGKKLILCGIALDHDYPLAGHSDADVGLHAITDALLGTIGTGDIGVHFPPSNPAYKNMDSSVFLKKAVSLIEEKGGNILHIDLTLICERPKITPHADAMKKRISEIVGIAPARISIKATTTEGLGFTGRGEGIAAQAIASVRLPCF